MSLEVQKPLRASGAVLPHYSGPVEGQYVDVSVEVLRDLIENGNEFNCKVTQGPSADAVIVAIDVDWNRQLIRLHYDREVEQPVLTRITP